MTAATIMASECPACGTTGNTVKFPTLQALLKCEFVAQGAEADYRFCDAEGCDVVYFGNGHTFTQSQLKVAVGVKETGGDRPLCYCFGHSVATIKEELCRRGRSDALDDIRRKMQDAGCSCAVKNPSGSCCLGAISRAIEVAKSELEGHSLQERVTS